MARALDIDVIAEGIESEEQRELIAEEMDRSTQEALDHSSELLDQMADFFDLRADRDLQVMQAGQTLPELTARLMRGIMSMAMDVTPASASRRTRS